MGEGVRGVSLREQVSEKKNFWQFSPKNCRKIYIWRARLSAMSKLASY